MSDQDVIEPGVRERVHRVLSGQSPEYFIYPNAAAFAADGLEPEIVARELAAMEAEGMLERDRYEVVVTPVHEVLASLSLTKRILHLAKGTEPDALTEPRAGGWRILDAHRIDLLR